MLSVRGLTVRRDRRMVLEDVSFSAARGAVTAVLGAAGSGKTSLLAALAGLLPTLRGAVFAAGNDVTKLAPNRRWIGLLPPGTSLRAHRRLPAALRDVVGRGARTAIAPAMEALGLAALADRRVDSFSHGEALLALATARALPPDPILLIDEAGAGLDDDARSRFTAALRAEAAAGRTILLATRSPDVALSADMLVLLAAGRVLQAGRPASLYAEPVDAEAARLTGPANILTGRIRELRPGGFVWTNGTRFLHATEPDNLRPVLGSDLMLCLRPERIALLGGHEAAENAIEGEVKGLRSAGAMLIVTLRSHFDDDLLISVPSWRPAHYPALGQTVRIGWAADAGWSLS